MKMVKIAILTLLLSNLKEIKAVEIKKTMFNIEYGAKITRFHGKFASFQLGLPIFMNNDYQKVLDFTVNDKYAKGIVSIKHNLKYLYFSSIEQLNNNQITEFKINLKLEKKLMNVKLELLPWKNYNVKSNLYLKYTKGDDFFEINHPYVIQLISNVKNYSYADKVRYLFNHVRNTLKYNPNLNKYRKFSEILATVGGDCGDYSTFLVTLLRAAGIPSRIVTGRILSPTLFGSWHAWAEYLCEGYGWVACDPGNIELNDNNILVAYMPINYASVHTGVNIPKPNDIDPSPVSAIQTYFYFYKPEEQNPQLRFSFDLLWNVNIIDK